MWWIIPLIILNIFAAYFTFKVNVEKTIPWQIALYCLNLSPLWIVVAKHSKNVVLDGIMYDIILTISYTISILLFTYGQVQFNMLQYLGILLLIIGFVIFKIGG